MGEVYRATDTVLGRTVAVKLLAERHARNEDVRERFKREALAAAQLSGHPHVVTVYDVGEQDDRPFIVMEYLGGGSVHDRLRAGEVAPGDALDWLHEAAEGIDAAHARGIVHRDVKPANLLFDDDGSVRVTDFGIASASGYDTLTIPGTILGTAGYLSPEQARGEPATPASDRYALGVVAFELLTGRRPFAAETPVTEAFAHLNADMPSAESISPALPPGVDAALSRSLSKEPRERPRTSVELVADLREAFRDDRERTLVQPPAARVSEAPAALQSTPTPTVRRHARRRATALPYGITALAVVLAGLAVAALVAAFADGDGSRGATNGGRPTTSQPTTTAPTTTEETTAEETTETPPQEPSGAELNDTGFRLMEDRRYEEALPYFERAVRTLRGTGSLAEAYASYNLAFTRFALGSCDGVLELLDRSESVQGRRDPIDSLRAEARDACREGDDEGEGSSGKGEGKGKKKGQED